MNLFKKSFAVLLMVLVFVSLVGFTQKVFAYENSFSIFENATTLRFVTAEQTIPDQTNFFSGQTLTLSGQIKTDNNLFSFGNTTVSMKATMYEVTSQGESLFMSPQYIIPPNTNLNFDLQQDSVTGSTTFSLPQEYSDFRIRIETKAFGDEIVNREFDFKIRNPSDIIVNAWAVPSTISFGQTSTIHWEAQANPLTGISCSRMEGGNLNGTSGTFETEILYAMNAYTVVCNNSLPEGAPGAKQDIAVAMVYVPAPSVSATAQSPIMSGNGSVISYTATASKSCDIYKLDNLAGIPVDAGGKRCPTSGMYYTGAFTNTGDTNIATSYFVSCGVGSYYEMPQSGDCNGPGADGTVGVNYNSSIKIANNIEGTNWIEKIRNIFSKFVPKIFAEGGLPPAASVTVGITVTPQATQLLPTLDFQSGNVKDLVKKNSSDEIGTTYLVPTISGLTSGYSCGLRNITTAPDIDIGARYTTNGNFPARQVSSLSNQNIFKLICNDPGNTESNPIEVFGQSGTLNAVNQSCTINANQSSCTIPATWTTINPMSGVDTIIKNLFNNVTVLGQGSSGNKTLTIPGGVMSPGESFGLVLFNSTNKVDGSNNGAAVENELDNIAVDVYCADNTLWNGTICAANATPLPDLIAFAPTPTVAITGVPTIYNTTIRNQGTVSSGGSFFNLFQTASGLDDAYNPIDLVDHPRVSTGPLSANTSKNIVSPSISFPTSGTYIMRVCADKSTAADTGIIPEGNSFGTGEFNNCSGWVNITVSSASAPDLIASSPSPTIAYVGTAIKFTSTIKNQGSASTGKPFNNLFQTTTSVLPAAPITDYPAPLSTPTLLAGATSATTSPNITFPVEGTYFVRACADKNSAGSMGVVAESNENNNCSAPWTQVTVIKPSALPDLIMSNISPSTAIVGVTQVFTATVKNQGSLSTGIPFYNLLQWIDLNNPLVIHDIVSKNPMGALQAGASSTYTESFRFTNPGQYSIRVCADKKNRTDSYGDVVESNENNNCSPNWLTVTVSNPTTGIDLMASGPTIYNATVGTPVNFKSLISNNGTDSTIKSFYNMFQVASEANGAGTITPLSSNPKMMPALLGNGTYDVAISESYTFTGLAGTRSVRACADNDTSMVGTIAESNTTGDAEKNNCSDWVNIEIFGMALSDLTASEPMASAIVVDSPIIFSSIIKNEGEGSTVEKFVNLFQTSTSSDGTENLMEYPTLAMPALNSGNSNIAKSPAITFTTPGIYYVRACADKSGSKDEFGAIAETKEDNNCSSSWIEFNVGDVGVTTGSLNATDCTILFGNSCDSNITWNVVNPVVGADTAVTTDPNIEVGTGNTNPPNTTYPVEFGIRVFYLYHNNYDGLQPPMVTRVAEARCPINTQFSFAEQRCIAQDPNDPIDGVCGASHNFCSAGTSVDINDSPESYLWKCDGEPGGRTAFCSEDITIGDPGDITITSFIAKPERVLKGRSSTLTWTSEGADLGCSGSQSNGTDFNTNNQENGSDMVNPIITTTYTLTCRSSTSPEVTKTANVKVIVPVIIEN
jgi:hypothetical protein